MQCYAMLCNALLAVLSFAMHDLLGGAMLCIAILSFALHCVALHVHAFGRKNTPNWGRAGFIKAVLLGSLRAPLWEARGRL